MAERDSGTTNTSILPEWITNNSSAIQAQLTKKGVENFCKFSTKVNKLNDLITKLPEEVGIFEIYKITPKDLMSIFPDPFTALAHACEGLTLRWAFQHAYKTAAMFEGLNFGLERGNFLLTMSCARSIFEESAHVHHYLVKAESDYQEILKIMNREVPRFRKGKPPTAQWNKDMFTVQMQTIQRLVRSLQGSDFEWNELMTQIVTDDNKEVPDSLIRRDEIRKTHINDCLDSLEKKKIPATKIYGILSEMVHPNFGSNTLVVKTRKKLNDISGNVVLTSKPNNTEAAAWFFEILADPLCSVFDLEIDCIQRSQILGAGHQNLAKFLLPSGTQKSGEIRFSK